MVKTSSIELGNQYDISSSLLRRWIQMYNANIELKDYNPKREVLYWQKQDVKPLLMKRKEMSTIVLNIIRNYKETASLYDVSYSQVVFVGEKYDSDGEEGLVDKRGHHKLDDEVDELERLRRENVRLKRQLEEKDNDC